jgi:transcription elongation factor Elf1
MKNEGCSNKKPFSNIVTIQKVHPDYSLKTSYNTCYFIIIFESYMHGNILMGRVKELMMEMEEHEWEFTEVQFKCPSCNICETGSAELPVVYHHSEIEHFPVTITCDSLVCGASFNCTLTATWNEYQIELDDYSSVEVRVDPIQGFEPDPYPDWDEYDFDSSHYISPLGTFNSTISGLKTIANSVQLVTHKDMLLRMLFVQAITALEAFLSDTLIQKIAIDVDAQKRLLESKQLGIGEQKISLKDAIGIENFARTKLLNYLTDELYHRLNKVQKLYQIGLRIDIAPEKETLEVIEKAIPVRHDCVHRNGKIKDSDDKHAISLEQVEELIEAIISMVLKIDDRLSPF